MATKQSEPAVIARALIASDERFEVLVGRFGLPPVRTILKPALRFEQLCRAILHQQLATSAAQAIVGRVWDLAGGKPTPEFFLTHGADELRSCGVSAAKFASLADLATGVESGSIALSNLARLTDDAVIEQLTAVRGIGPWTAQMFLMSSLARHDVWPVLDYGVRAGWSALDGRGALITPKELSAEGERFRPWRSSVAWYCWRVADEAKQQR